MVAAGQGTRLGASIPKALVALSGRPLVGWCLNAFDRSADVRDIVVVAPPEIIGVFGDLGRDLSVPVRVVAGGPTRAESVANGLAAVPPDRPLVMVHDAARPLVTPAMVHAVLDAVGDGPGAILAAPVADTLKRVDDGHIVESPSRDGLWGAQTPQAFRADALRDAVALAAAHGTLAQATDCASLVAAAGGAVRVVDPGGPNLKVTTPADLALAEAILATRSEPDAVG